MTDATAEFLRRIADEFEQDSWANDDASADAESPEMHEYFKGKGEAYRRAADALELYATMLEHGTVGEDSQ